MQNPVQLLVAKPSGQQGQLLSLFSAWPPHSPVDMPAWEAAAGLDIAGTPTMT